jgi:aspartate/methionine/tyrosine aminotransferase
MAFLLNPLLVDTATPPVPEAKAWAAAYDGSAGPPIDMAQAVPGYPPHAEMLERLGKAAASREAASYNDILGDAKLRETYAAHVAKLYGGRIAAANVAITTGCNQGFFVAMLALAKAGDAVILPAPWYFNHKMALDMLGIEATVLPCLAENSFVPQAEDAHSLIGPRTRAIVLVTPNNPTGAIYPAKAVESFITLCAKNGIALVLDETYRDFIPADALHGGFAAPDWPETLIQLYSFSKGYCIPGHRAGAMIAGPRVIGEVTKVLDTLQICAPRVPQLALPWAIESLGEWRDANRAEILARGEAFRQAMAEVDGWTAHSVGAYLGYVEHPYRGASGSEICAWLAAERGVLALPGSYFGPEQEKFIRFAFANVGVEAIRQLPARLAARYGQRKAARARG